ncbi:MAG: cyanophycin synthetase [Planctomycetota bacterium]|jgi:UDP-N-acetylmuramate--alanine ligase|nr:cyanophycin synthetase [Planctomycetota bacterium]
MSTPTISATCLDELALGHGRVITFVGVGGCGMRGLATFFLQSGWDVYGYDSKPLSSSDELYALGLRWCDESTLPMSSWVVRSAAVPSTDPVFAESVAKDARPSLYAQFLGEISKLRPVIAVAGTHGKTTCTAWIAYGLQEAGVDVGYLVGAKVPQLGGSSAWGDPRLPLVVESCEYARSFHFLRPQKVALINVAAEHPDTYPGGLPEVKQSFAEFLSHTSTDGCVYAGPEAPTDLQSSTDAEWMTCPQLDLDVELGLFGDHNRRNASLVASVLKDLGLEQEQISHALASFSGASRRLELVGELTKGQCETIKLVSDYAHHPTEVAATINAAKQRFKDCDINVVFQPHQAQRFKDYRELYADCLDEADMVALLPIYRARDSKDCVIDSDELIPELDARFPQREHHFAKSIDSAIDWTLANSKSSSVMLCLGAGDIDGYLREIL